VEMDIWVSQVMHIVSRMDSTMDTGALHRQDLGEEWVDLVEAMDLFHWMVKAVKEEDILHHLKISTGTMASVRLQLDMAGRSLNARIQTTSTAHASTLHSLRGNTLTTLPDL